MLGPPRLEIETAGGEEHGIAERLGFEPAAVLPAEKEIVRIAAPVRRSVGLLIGRGVDDEPVHGLDRPAGPDEFRGQPVEQLGMRGRGAEPAEVVRRPYQPLAEMVLPDAVHHHPRGQRILRAGQPASQFQPAAALVNGLLIFSGEG